MTDEAPISSAEDEVRRLLVEARHTEPVPTHVAARLDRVLDGLAEEPARTAPVIQLARRRRRAAALLVAAAAVVAVGIGLNQVVQPGSNDAMEAPSAGSAGRELQSEDDGVTAQRDGAQAPEAADAEDSPAKSFAADRRLVELQSGDFADDVRSARIELTDGTLAGLNARGPNSPLRQTCRTATWGAGTFVPVRYDGEPAVVVFRRPQGDTQVADLFLCGSTEPDRSVTLPAP